jgi:hypothetical protein
MCDACFNQEVLAFISRDEYLAFDLALTQKITNDKTMRMGTFVETGYKDIGYHIYECLVCGQSWKLTTGGDTTGEQFLLMNK